jgi:hypothetical protein
MSSALPIDAPLLNRVRGEYKEMPGLSLTFGQACRLWQVDSATCDALLQRLVAEGFLVRSRSGMYGACASASMAWPHHGSKPSAA